MNKINKWIIAFCCIVSIAIISNCTKKDEVQLQTDKLPYAQLSDYQFFKEDIRELSPNEKVLPYHLNTPLFTDYSHKQRFVWMPKGKSAAYTPSGVVQFPDSTVLIKNFYYIDNEQLPTSPRRIIETRLLIQLQGKWQAHSYVWKDDQSDAVLDVVGGTKPVDWIDKNGNKKHVDYAIPNKNQCKSCHNINEVLQPIGPKVANLNRDYPYSSGTKNQLTQWKEHGFLTGDFDPATAPRMVQMDDKNAPLQQRALAYLEMNCGHCHNPNSPASTTGLYLTYLQNNWVRLGLYKSPVAAGKGSGGRLYDLVPQQPDSSILVYRMASIDPGVMMPEVGRTMIHEEGVALIREWITSIDKERVKQPVQ